MKLREIQFNLADDLAEGLKRHEFRNLALPYLECFFWDEPKSPYKKIVLEIIVGDTSPLKKRGVFQSIGIYEQGIPESFF